MPVQASGAISKLHAQQSWWSRFSLEQDEGNGLEESTGGIFVRLVSLKG